MARGAYRENTLAGSVHENYDHLVNFELPIVGESSVRIVHIAPARAPFSVTGIFPPAHFNQVASGFFRQPSVKLRIPFSMIMQAGSVKMVMEEGLTDAEAIASSVAAEIYGGNLRCSIESDRQNFTDFFFFCVSAIRLKAISTNSKDHFGLEDHGGLQHPQYSGS